MLTDKQKEVISFLEGLVHGRYNLETLNKILSEFFGEDIKAEFVDNDCPDWNIMFNSENEDTYGYYDIYVLKMKDVGHFSSADFYITEVAYEFE
jgi:hypothetical protein